MFDAIQCLLYSIPSFASRGYPFAQARPFVYNIDLVRQLCRDISAEPDPQKSNDLIILLQAVIRDDLEEMRARVAFLANKYPINNESQAAD